MLKRRPKIDYQTILLVEDDAVTSLRESRLLEREGYSIITAATGKEAVAAVMENLGIDLILMDIDLGRGMDGTQAAEKILKDRDIPILFLSSHSEKEVVDRTEKITSYGYVLKSSGDTVLLASIRLAFRLYEAYQLNRVKSEKLAAANEELNAAVEELEATNEEFQATIDELEDTKQNLESLLVDHTQAEERLSESEAAFRSLFEATPVGVAILVNRVFKKVNSTMCNITGYSEEELIDKTTEMLYPDTEEFLRVGREIYDSIHETALNTLESRFTCRDGSMIDVLISLSPLERGNSSKGVAITVQDITELKQSQEQYSTIVQTALDGFVLQNSKGILLYVNEKYCEITGYSRDELVGMHVSDIEVIDTKQEIEARIKEVITGGYARFESVHRRKNGELINVEVSIKGMKDHPDRIFAFVRDITEKKKAEDFLQMYRFTIDQLSDQVLWFKRDASFEYVNDQACRMLGYTRDELMELTLFDIDPFYPRERWEAEWEGYKDERREWTVKAESMQRRKDGTLFPVEVVAQNLWFGDRDLHVAVVRDITERKKVEETLLESEVFLRKSQESAGIGSYILMLPDNIPAHQTWTCTPAMDRIFGIDENYPKNGEAWLNLIVQCDEVERYFEQQVFEIKQEFRMEYQITRPSDGIVRWIMGIGEIEFNDEGIPLRMIGTVQDITERKEAEEALRESELFLRKSQEIGGIGSYILDMPDRNPKNQTWRCSKSFEEIFGIDSNFIRDGESWLSLIVQRDDLLQYYNEQVDNRCQDFVYEYQITRPSDGEIRWILAIGETEYDGQWNPVRLIGTVQDITERKLAEESLIQERDFTRDALNSLPGLFYLFNKGGKFLRWNNNFRAVSGYSDEEIAAITPLDLFAGDDKNLIAERIVKVFETGESTAEADLISKDGTETPCYFTGKLFLLKGEPCIVGMGIDITERKRALELLKESEERWKFALEGAGDGLWDWNHETSKVHYSSRWKSMLGYADDEISDDFSEWETRVHPDDLEQSLIKVKDLLDGNTPLYINEHRLRCRDGSYKWILARGKIIERGPGGAPTRIIGTHTDIDEHKKTEEMLQKASDEKQSLLLELQHRMKNSLVMIIGILELEIERTEYTETKNILRDLLNRIDSLSNLYRLLYQSDTVTEVFLNEYMHLITSSLTGTYLNSSSHITIEEKYEPMSIDVKGATAWGLILNELLTNSLKYAFNQGDTGHIRVVLQKKSEKEIELAIADNGNGPPADFKLENSTGFGLLLVRMLAQQLKGSVTFKRGKENTFSVRAPV